MSLHPTFPRGYAAKGHHLVERWCTLAEARLAYLTELFDSGRWRRFHSEREFFENIQEARVSVDRWRALLADDAAVGQAEPLGLPWNRLSHVSQRAAVAHAPGPYPASTQAARLVASNDTPDHQASPARETVTPSDFDWQEALAPAAIADRYPMLRAAM